MAVSVRVPGSLGTGPVPAFPQATPQGPGAGRPAGGLRDSVLVIDPCPATLGDLVSSLDERIPGLAAALAKGGFNFVVNDEVLLHGASRRRLQDGDRVELLPAIAGGQAAREPGRRAGRSGRKVRPR